MREPRNDVHIDLPSVPFRALRLDLVASRCPSSKSPDAVGANRLLVTEVLV